MTKSLAIIPARGGSKGITNKNLRKIGSISLLDHAVNFAYSSGIFSDIVVSTNSDEIGMNVDVKKAIWMKRPESISLDNSLVIETIRHVLIVLRDTGNKTYEHIFLLEPTSPFRTQQDLKSSLEILENTNCDSVSTFTQADPPPGRIWKIENEIPTPYIGGSNPFLPRQVQPTGYQLTGEIYGMKVKSLEEHHGNSLLFGKSKAVISSAEFIIDIDNEKDLIIANEIYKTQNENSRGTI